MSAIQKSHYCVLGGRCVRVSDRHLGRSTKIFDNQELSEFFKNQELIEGSPEAET
jgi:hypothetical protein